MALADIPFYGAYRQVGLENEVTRPAAELQQTQAAMGLMGALQKQQMAQAELRRNAELRAKIAALPPEDRTQENILPLILESGNIKELVPLLKSKSDRLRSVAPGHQLVNEKGEVLYTAPAEAPKPESMPEIVRLQNYLKNLPANDPHRAPIEARIKLLTERPGPQAVVNMPPTSGTFQGPDGKFYIFRVGKDGKTEAVPIQTSSGDPLRPPETPAERTARADAAAQESTLEGARSRINKMVSLIQGNTGIVGPAGMVRRVGETAAGVVAPDIPTPALDFENEKSLLLADVRKLIEKDPNLSNQERQALYQTLGSGTFQTPGSAIRALNNVIGFMENKKTTGPGRQANLEGSVKAAGWAYEPDKYEYRVVNGQVQRRAKGN